MSTQKRNTFRSFIFTTGLVLVYLVGGMVALNYVDFSKRAELEEDIKLLRDFAATAVIVFALIRLCIDKLRGEGLWSILVWFFAIAAGAVLITNSWLILAFLGLVFLVLLFVEDSSGSGGQDQEVVVEYKTSRVESEKEEGDEA